MMQKNAINNQDHQKGVDTREVSKNNQNHLKKKVITISEKSSSL